MVSFDKKSPQIKQLLERIAGKKIDGSSCALCHSLKVQLTDFRDELSWKEFGISRQCQECQDKIWPPNLKEE